MKKCLTPGAIVFGAVALVCSGQGVISTVAGNGGSNSAGDGGRRYQRVVSSGRGNRG